MFFEMFTKKEIKYTDDDYKVFDLQNIESFDKKKIEERFKNLIKCIREEECKYLYMLDSNTTHKNEVRYEQFTLHKSDPTSKIAIARIETEEELLIVYNLLERIFDISLSYSEKIVFVESILLKRTRDYIENRLHIGNEKFYQIRNSCLIKFALGLNWSDIKVNNDNEGLL